jgi:16S rRNA (cytidine1402-2'-O)-methyltransferase
MGTLFVVATPIGNLSDVSARCAETLKNSDFIVCEDTRVSRILLNHLGIGKELVSMNAQSENKKINYIIDRISSGENCSLISDAGTPGISDPGVRLISASIKAGVEISGIPGPNAAVLALSISGLPTDAFVFEGFIPQKKGRQKKLQELANEPRTIIIYESMYRIEKLIAELDEYMPGRFVVIWRELTKKFEESWRGYPSEIKDSLNEKTIKGEFVVVISPLNWRENYSES